MKENNGTDSKAVEMTDEELKFFAGFEERNVDIIGTWQEDVSGRRVCFTPLFASAFDSKLDSKRANLIVHGRLEFPCKLVSTADKDETIDGKPGDLIGVFVSPGMKTLECCAGVVTLLERDGEKDVGRPQPMKTYKVKTKKAISTEPNLELRYDYRDDSAEEGLPIPVRTKSSTRLAPPGGNEKRGKGDAVGGEDSIPF
jgi:hypothetical protein